ATSSTAANWQTPSSGGSTPFAQGQQKVMLAAPVNDTGATATFNTGAGDFFTNNNVWDTIGPTTTHGMVTEYYGSGANTYGGFYGTAVYWTGKSIQMSAAT